MLQVHGMHVPGRGQHRIGGLLCRGRGAAAARDVAHDGRRHQPPPARAPAHLPAAERRGCALLTLETALAVLCTLRQVAFVEAAGFDRQPLLLKG